MPLPADYYSILRIPRTATTEQIRTAYKHQALKLHPQSKTATVDSAKLFEQLSEAYDVLSQPKWRAIYDEYGERGLKQGIPSLNIDKCTADAYTFNKDPLQLFQDLFGHHNAVLFTQPQPTTNDNKVPDPQHINLYVSLEELLTGCTKKQRIHVQRLTHSTTDPQQTRTEESLLTVDVGKGWRDGTKITFQGVGDEVYGCKQRGAVIFTLRIKPHPHFTRQDDDILHIVTLSLKKALCGMHFELAQLDGRTINVSTSELIASPYNEKVIKGQGLPRRKSTNERGDLRLRFKIQFPDTLTLEQKRQLAQILPD